MWTLRLIGGALVLSLAPVALAAVSDVDVCKATIGAVMNRDPSIMVAADRGDLISVSYTRDDGTSWAFKCKIQGSRVLWGNLDGRWRDTSMDSQISYRVDGNTVTITELYSDGSRSEDSFSF
jgi:hypothetical protein